MVLKESLSKIVEGKDLTEAEASDAMTSIMDGSVSSTQIAAFLTALRMKGETIEEITGFARAMRARAFKISADDGPVVDTCGTGGDGKGTFNISTAVAFVVAACGLQVAKHENRSVSSRCGSADVLEALGIDPCLPPERAEVCLREFGLAFLFAPAFHPATRHAAAVRREIGIRTVFNLLGPLTNPAGASVHLAGAYRKDVIRPMAEVLRNLGSRAAFVVHGEDGSDEITIACRTAVCWLRNGTIEEFFLEPEMAGIRRSNLEAIQGGTPERNAEILRGVLEGVPGPPRDVVILNSAAALLVAERVSDLTEGAAMASEAIDSGRAMQKLRELVRFSKKEEK